MADQQPTPPLWRVMNQARIKATTFYRDDEGALMEMPPDGNTCAAELRAIADAVVPEEECPYSEWHPTEPGEVAKWQQRMDTRRRFLAEADRAEAGE